MKKEEEFIREKIRQNHTVPMSFSLSRIDFLNGEEAMVWVKEYSDLTNAKLVEENERLDKLLQIELDLSAHYNGEMDQLQSELSALKEENERLKGELIMANNSKSRRGAMVESLQSELSAAKERVNLYKDATNDLCKLLCLGYTKDELLKAIKVLADLNNTNP